MIDTKHFQGLKRLLILLIIVGLVLPITASGTVMTAHALTGSASSVLGPSPLWGAGSPFNMRIPQGATYARETRIGTFRYGYEEWSMPVTRVAPGENVPTISVINRYSGRVEHWPIPRSAQPAPESDAHMGVMHPDSNVIYEMWDATWIDSNTIRAGGMMSFPLDGSGVSDPPHYRVTAAGFAVSAGMIMREDFTDPASGALTPVRPIQHALTMSLPFDLVAHDEYIAPAVGGEIMGSAGSNGVPMGAHFALPPTLDVDSLNVHPLTRELLRAARDYGIYVNDTNGTPTYNGKYVGAIRIEPGLVQDLYGTAHNDLLTGIQAEIYDVIQSYGIYRITLPAVAAPVAMDDTYSTEQESLLEGAAPGVLANDSDINGDPMTAAQVSGPENGTLALHTDGHFTYMPDAGFSGTDSFTYTASDGQHNSNVAQVTISVNAASTQNEAPTAGEDAYTVDEDAQLDIGTPGVLANDDDRDADPLTALLESAPQHGTLDLSPDGAFSYLPAENYNGSDSFTYRASDGSLGSAATTVTLTIVSRNDAPVLNGVFDQTVTAGESLTFTLSASDIDSHDLVFSADSLPAGAALNPATGAFSWTPEATQVGAFPLTMTVSDGDLSDSAAMTITVQEGNLEPPVVEPPSDALFADGFESGNLAAWAKAVTRSGALTVTPQAALEGSYGMQITVDSTRSRYVRGYLPDDLPAGWLSFRFAPNGLQMASGDTFNLFQAGSSNRSHALRLKFRFNGTDYQLRAQTRADNGRWSSTGWIDIANMPQIIGLVWQQASADASNGSLTLTIDGESVATVDGVDNDQRVISQVQWGAPSGLDLGTQGTFYLDSFAVFAGRTQSAATATLAGAAPAGNCTLSAEYWSTHGESGPDALDPTWQTLGAAGSETELLWGYSYGYVLWYGTFGNGVWFQLARDYAAAELNQAHGASLPTELANTFALAYEMLGSQNPAESLTEAHRATFEDLSELLQQFNNGLVGPGNCPGF